MAEENKATDKVLRIVKAKGPVIPTDVSKEMGVTTILASAMLSELVSGHQLRISSLKMGGTPFYYAPGQEEKLQNYTKYLHEQEKKAYDVLKSKLVLRDRNLEPVVRVALRQIKDFAVPLNVRNKEDVETFWKWYLASNEDAEPLIRKILGVEEKPAEEAPSEKVESAEAEKDAKPSETEKPPEPPPQKDSREKAREQKKSATEKPAAEKTAKKPQGDFLGKVTGYFSSNGIEVLESFPDKRKREAEFVIKVPSSVGTVKHFCKAKDKKNCNDGDLSTAYVQGQAKNLPVLFLTTGKLTKRAEEMLSREFSDMNFKRL